MLKTTNVEFLFIEIWFTYQINRPLEIEDNALSSISSGLLLFYISRF